MTCSAESLLLTLPTGRRQGAGAGRMPPGGCRRACTGTAMIGARPAPGEDARSGCGESARRRNGSGDKTRETHRTPFDSAYGCNREGCSARMAASTPKRKHPARAARPPRESALSASRISSRHRASNTDSGGSAGFLSRRLADQPAQCCRRRSWTLSTCSSSLPDVRHWYAWSIFRIAPA